MAKPNTSSPSPPHHPRQHQHQQEEVQDETLRKQSSTQEQTMTTMPSTSSAPFYPHSIAQQPDQRSGDGDDGSIRYERRESTSSRRPYDAVLDASPPPSGASGAKPGSSSYPSHGMSTTLDSQRNLSSSSSRRSDVYTLSRPDQRESQVRQPVAGQGARVETSSSYGTGDTSQSSTTMVSSASERIQASSFNKSPSSRVENEKSTKPSLEGFSRSRNGCRYRLVVVQHPTRARMCGFGDKDRRPLSPTLIVKLVITDEQTGEEISPWKVNTSLFFLASDLCHPDDLMLSPRNVLVHQHAASIPTAMLHQPHMQDYPSSQQQQQQQQQQRPSSPYAAQNAQSSSSSVPLPSLGGLYLGDRSRPSDAGLYSQHATSVDEQQQQQHSKHPSQSQTYSSGLTTVTTEHYTRNLVGAAVTSANVLRDEQDNYAIFFVLQDLSVRTEGVYRIRLMFTNLAQHDGQTNEGVSEALAETYTEPFSVYSPRRFPGMLEPTELSKKLASQGIKIAVRSDKKKRRRGSEAGVQGLPGEVDGLEDDDDE